MNRGDPSLWEEFLYGYQNLGINFDPFWKQAHRIHEVFLFVMAFLLYSLFWRALRGERWVLSLSLALAFPAALGTLYFTLKALFEPEYHIYLTPLDNLGLVVSALFFFTASKALDEQDPFERNDLRTILEKIRKESYWLLFFFAFVSIIELLHLFTQVGSPLDRFPSAVFYCICIGMLIWHLCLEFWRKTGFTRYPMAVLTFLIGVGIITIQIIYALNPYLALKLMGFDDPLVFFGQQIPAFSNLQAMDGLTEGLLMAFEVTLFLVVFYQAAGITAVLSPLPGILKETTEGNVEYLDPDCRQGILKALGVSTGADHVALTLRYPGKEASKVAWWAWFDDAYWTEFMKSEHLRRHLEEHPYIPEAFKQLTRQDLRAPVLLDEPKEDENITGSVLHYGTPVVSRDWQKTHPDQYQEILPGLRSFISVPITYQNGVIGALALESRRPGAFSPTTVRNVLRMSRYLAPTLHSRRELQALRELKTRLDEKIRSPKSMTSLLKDVVCVLQDILEPSGTCLVFGYGFRSLVIFWDSKKGDVSDPMFYQGDGKAEEGVFYSRFNAEYVFPAYPLRGFERGRSAHGATFSSGLIFAVRTTDRPHKPTLGRDQLFGHSVADLTVSAIFEGCSLLTGKIVDTLQRSLDKGASEPENWYQALQGSLRQNKDASSNKASLGNYGARWVGASLEGKDEYIGIGRGLMIQSKKPYIKNNAIEVYHLTEPWEGAHSVVALILESSNAVLFLGFEL